MTSRTRCLWGAALAVFAVALAVPDSIDASPKRGHATRSIARAQPSRSAGRLGATQSRSGPSRMATSPRVRSSAPAIGGRSFRVPAGLTPRSSAPRQPLKASNAPGPLRMSRESRPMSLTERLVGMRPTKELPRIRSGRGGSPISPPQTRADRVAPRGPTRSGDVAGRGDRSLTRRPATRVPSARTDAVRPQRGSSDGDHRSGAIGFRSDRTNPNNFGSRRDAYGRRAPSIDLTIGGRGDRFGGYLRFGRDGWARDFRGLLFYDGDRHDRWPRCYPRWPRYYRGYRPIHHYPWAYREPWYGYVYATTYFPAPYVYRVYDTDVYYIDRTYVVDDDGFDGAVSSVTTMPSATTVPSATVTVPSEIATIEEAVVSNNSTIDARPRGDVAVEPGPPPTRTPAAGETQPPEESYVPLTEPGDTTLLGKGNAAFLAGQYEDAQRSYAGAILADERDGYAKFLYALANTALADYEVAGLALRRALLTTADLIDYPVDIRTLYPDRVRLDAQVTALAAYVDLHAQDQNVQLLLGYMHYAAGDPGPAKIVLDGLIARHPDDELAALLRDAVLRVSTMKPSDK